MLAGSFRPFFLLFPLLCLFALGVAAESQKNPPARKESRAWSKIEDASKLQEKAQLSEEFLKKFPRSRFLPYVHNVLARFALQHGQINQFVEHAEKSLQEVQRNPHLLIALAVEYAERAKVDKATDLARQGLKILGTMPPPENTSSFSWTLFKNQLLADGHYALGLASLHQFTHDKIRNQKMEPTERPLRSYRYGNLAKHVLGYSGIVSAKEWKEQVLASALEHLKQATNLDPKHDRAYYRLGLLFNSENKLEETAENFARAAVLDGSTSALAKKGLEFLHESKILKENPQQLISYQLQHFRSEIDKKNAKYQELVQIEANKKQREQLLNALGSGRFSEVALTANSAASNLAGGSGVAGQSSVTRGGLIESIRGLKEGKKLDKIGTPEDLARVKYAPRVKLALRKLKSGFALMKKVRENALASRKSNGDSNTDKIRWKKQLKKLRDLSEKLRDLLSQLFPYLRKESIFKPQIHDEAYVSGFQKEFRFIQKELVKAEKQIVNHVLGNTAEKTASQPENNMLILLDRVGKMADQIQKEL